MADRRVKVIFSAEIQGFKQAMADAATATEKSKRATEEAGKAADKSAAELAKLALAHHEAAKAAGLQYDNTGQLVTMNGKAVTSQQAAALGLQTFSKEAYLAGRAAVSAGEDAERAAKAAAEAEKKAAEAAEKHRAALENVGRVAAIGGAAVLAGVGLAVKAYADFDKQMSSVDAATHETAGNMGKLRKAAIDAGADTAFSAVEAAQGIEEMAKAGVSTADILGGGLKGTLALAAAGALGVGDASEIASSAMTQFGLRGKDIPHIADLLAAAAGKAQGSVQDMGLALSYAGVPAAGLGISIEQTTGTLALFAKSGIVGEKAGTALRAMLVSMVKPADTTKKTMDDLGITFSDSKGKFIGLDGAAGVLRDKLGGLDDMTRNATLAQIFGNEALGAAQTLYKGGAKGVQDMTAAVDDYGYATDTAARMQNNLTGDLEKLGGSFDTVLIQSGSGANEVLRGLVQNLEGFIDAVGKVPAPALGAATGLAAIVGGAALIGGTLITVIPKIRETRDAFNELAPAGGRARGALEAVGKAAGGMAALGTVTLILAKIAESDYMSQIDQGMGKVADALADVTTNAPGAAKSLDSLFQDRDGGNLIQGVEDLNTAMQRTFNKNKDQEFNDWAEGIVNGMTGVKGSSQILGDAFGRVDKSLAGMVSGGKAEDAAKAFDKIEAAAKIQGATVEELAAKFPEYADALKAAEAAAKTAAPEGDKVATAIKSVGDAAEAAKSKADDIAKALEDVGLAADGSIVDIDKFAQSLFNAGLLTLSASDAAIAHQDAIDKMTESIKTNGTTLDINTEAGRANQSALNNIAQTAIVSAEATAKHTLATQGSKAAQDELQGALRTSYDDLVAAAGQLGITGDAADTLARNALGVPKNVNLDAWIADHASATLDGIKGKADDLDGRVVHLSVVEQYTKMISEIKNPTQADLNGDTFRPDGGFTGGRVADLAGLAGGGKVPGNAPSDMSKDNVLAMVNGKPFGLQSEEWVINGRSSQKYDRELAAINAGTFPKLPGYTAGGRAGREYSAQSLGYSPAGGQGSVSIAAPDVKVFIGNEQLDSRMYRVADGAIASSDSSSKFSRRGR